MGRVTSSEVARLSGVSRATVSYVLNDTPNQSISEQTRRRVLAAVEQLGYTPYAPARALRAGRSEIVLLRLPGWRIGPDTAELLDDLAARLRQDGLTVVAQAGPEAAGALAPAAVLDLRPPPNVQRAIGRVQAEHLVRSGHRRLGFAAPPGNDQAQHRLAGVRQICAERRLPEPLIRTVPPDADAAEQAAASWYGAAPQVTGVCAYDDETALSVLAGMRRRRLAAPWDLAVIGAGADPVAALTSPAPTTVRVDLAGHLAAVVRHKLRGEPPPDDPGPGMIRLVRRDTA
jgi:DNA-binding LacI/PurR family transcriptional regulator